ncbi:MAG: RidA family protein [Bryobacterales bacterium]|nr:RidA family protein [Bryobacterales bacterium]
MKARRAFLKSAAGLGAMATMAEAAAPGGRSRVKGGIRVGNLLFSSGLTSPGADVTEQTHGIMKMHKANLEAMGSSLENVVKVTVFMADVRKEKPAMNKAYAEYFPKDAPSRSCVGVDFPDDETRLEIELVAWIP